MIANKGVLQRANNICINSADRIPGCAASLASEGLQAEERCPDEHLPCSCQVSAPFFRVTSI